MRRKLVLFPLIALATAANSAHAALPCPAIARQATIALGSQSGAVLSSAFTADGKKLVLTTAKGKVVLVDLKSGKPERDAETRYKNIWSVQPSKDGKKWVLATGQGKDSEVVILDSESLKELKKFPTKNGLNPYSAELSPDGSKLALFENTPDGAIHTASILDASSGDVIFQTSFASPVAAAHFSADGKDLISYDRQIVLRALNVIDGSVDYELKGVQGVELTASRERILINWNDNMLELLDVRTGRKTHTFTTLATYATLSDNERTLLTGEVKSSYKTPDGKRILIDEEFKARDASNGIELRAIGLSFDLRTEGIAPIMPALSPDGKFVLAGAGDGSHMKLMPLVSGCPDLALANSEDFYAASVAPSARFVLLGIGSGMLQLVELK